VPAWLTFAGTAAIVVIAGTRLAKHGDVIAARTGLGSAWVGAILVAAATSLPELVTDVAAVRQGEPALAIGDLFGSSMANVLILAIADLFTRQTRLLARVTLAQAMVGVLAMALTTIAAIGILSPFRFTIAGIGWTPLVIGAAYVLGMRVLYENRSRKSAAEGARWNGELPTLRRAVIGFSAAAAAIFAAGPYLASSAATLAAQLGISSGFFGFVFLAAATSLPEGSAIFAAVRAGSYDLAVGNLLGSNCFNMCVLIALDIADGPGSLLAGVDPGIVVGALIATLLTGEAVVDVLNRSERRIWYLEPGPALIVLTYAGGLVLTYRAMS
jgi:cation:H+ antiporter